MELRELVLAVCIALTASSLGAEVPTGQSALEQRMAVLEIRVDDALRLDQAVYQRGIDQTNQGYQIIFGLFTVITVAAGFFGLSTYRKLKVARKAAETVTAEMKTRLADVDSLERQLSTLRTEIDLLVAEKVKLAEDYLATVTWDDQTPLNEEAMKNLAFVLAAKPQLSPNEQFLQAGAAYQAKDFQKTCDILSPLIHDDPANSKFLNSFGLAKRGIGELEVASRYFGLAFQNDPQAWKPKMHQAVCFKELGQPHRALEILTEANLVELSDNDPLLLITLAAIEIDLGDPQSALETLTVAESEYLRRERPVNALIPYNQACAHIKLQDKTQAAQALRRSFDSDPTRRDRAKGDPEVQVLFTREELDNL